ncbi:hypothetical protein [Roseibium sp. RKSG952]|uniref:hypothetical protein n=1 Tax=Roseibium sp. RKSG952 TaxID=2529384 RepID=UPI0012BBC0F2|nr:hypothetical protein [Roseibium sp. RKSG952]MTH95158.1 hypothetical protein [Roseibium sp. RKSG952]
MTPDEVEQKARALFGENWKHALARSLGVNYSTLWRQMSQNNIPGPVVAAMKAWIVLFESLGVRPPIEPGGPVVPPKEDVEDVYGVKKKPGGKRKATSTYSKLIG